MGMMGNINNMACMYFTKQCFLVINKEKGLVLKDDVNGPLNSSDGMNQDQTKVDGK